jgi:L,D-transpeptidase YcbB
MKKIINIAALLAVVFASCQNFVKNDNENNLDSLSAHNAYASMDRSITAENAYSDLFLDSTVIENYISKEKLDDSTARSLRSFYTTRNLQYAWFSSNGLTEQGRSFWYLYDYGKKEEKDDTLLKQLDTLAMSTDTTNLNASDSSLVQLELLLTKNFIQYKQEQKDSSLFALEHPVPVRKMDVMQWADSILKNGDIAQHQNNKAYTALKQHLSAYHSIAQKGGWQPVSLGTKQLKKGAKSPAVVAIKKRLQLTGDYTVNDTTNVFSDSLEAAIRYYQERNGFQSTGVVTDSLVQVMNVPVERRLEQILINLNRMAWAPAPPGDNYLVVNVPDFMLHIYEAGKEIQKMEVIVGKEGTNTMMFKGDLNQIVFSPYWNIPQSIVQNEIMPAMKNDPNYLKKKNMEIVKQGDIPQMRQLPGKDNALGRVKFLFPNSFDIYLHDTPHKGLFDQNNRALSHGCIRVADAEGLAQYLLRDQKDWTPEKIQAAMNSGKEQTVKLGKSVPVVITYYTAWVDETGKLHFGNDIYGHDDATGRMMFTSYSNQNPGIAPGTDSLNKKDTSAAKRKA